MDALYSIFDNPFARKELAGFEVPNYVLDNLRAGYGRRPYQIEAFKRFVYYDTNDFDGKPNKPTHLLYNMATGSGKTLVMAGLILYLYEKGHRNFLFFVHSTNIIEKTKDNFLNQNSSKYLFSNKLAIDGRDVLIKEVENFDEADETNINIKFTTIQQLHSDLISPKENSITFEDFENRKTVLIADEAHHLNAGTKKQGDLFGSWEDTVMKVLDSSFDNILLEFTATMDYESREIAEKYKNKAIYKYDLAEFRIDKYSKEINLIRSHYDEQERIIQALILNLYRQELATIHNINLKPVILFKAKRTIAESEKNKEDFHKLIDGFSGAIVQKIQTTSTVAIVQKAFSFFKKKKLSTDEIAKRIKSNFRAENCISANNDKEKEQNQIRLNTLEDEDNPIRAIFAVQKLNEGWDVLNLFDIVRLYTDRDDKNGNPGKTTISEAQLIGRGARYFPFSLEEGQDLYTRKFDEDITNDLKILEELYYHTVEDSRYITALKKALVETGIYEDDENLETKQLILKDSFKKTDFYKEGYVVFNKKVEKSYGNVKSFTDLGVTKKNFSHVLSSGHGSMSRAFSKTEPETKSKTTIKPKDIPVANIPSHIIRYALTNNPFYYFDRLIRFFPELESLSNFIESKDYLGGLEITLSGTKSRLADISNGDYLNAVQGLLKDMEAEMKSNLVEYEGSEYIKDYIHKVFIDKPVRVPKSSERANGQFEVVNEPNWYVYNANYGTKEEKDFVEMFARRFEHLEKKFSNIYLIRNERILKIHDKRGRAFEPDFILFCKQNEGEELIFQVFIEPKGIHLVGNDKWKEDFLKEIAEEKFTLRIDTDKYLITGVPFYNNKNENEFTSSLEDTLNLG